MDRVPMNTLRRTTSGIGVLAVIAGSLVLAAARFASSAGFELATAGFMLLTIGAGLALVPLSRSVDSPPLRIAATFAGSSVGLLTLLPPRLLTDPVLGYTVDSSTALRFGAEASAEFLVPAVLWYVAVVVLMWFLSRYSPGTAATAPHRFHRRVPPFDYATPPAQPQPGSPGSPVRPQPGPGVAVPGSGPAAPAERPVPVPEPDRHPVPIPEPEPRRQPVAAPEPAPAPVPVAPAPMPQPEPARHLGLSRSEWFTVGMTLLAAVLSTAGSVIANLLTK